MESIEKMTQGEFISRFSHIYENSPWIVETVWDMGLGSNLHSINDLHSAMVNIVDTATQTQQLSLLRNHPELATRQKKANTLTEASRSEQKNAGLSHCENEDLDEFEVLNLQYKDKFGFPFILAVKNLKVPEILSIFRERIKNQKEDEFKECLRQVHKIALFRLLENSKK